MSELVNHIHNEGFDGASLVVAVPACLTPTKRAVVRELGVQAGANVIRVVSYPVAAAHVLAYHPPGSRALVVDIRRTAAEVSLLSPSVEKAVEIERTACSHSLGGEVCTINLMQWVKGQVGRVLSTKPELLSDRAVRRIAKACEGAKRALSSSTTARIQLDELAEGRDLDLLVSRAKFEALNRGYFDALADFAASVLTQPPDSLVLIGGGSLVPKARNSLMQQWPDVRCVHVPMCRDEVVVTGAAELGATILSLHPEPAMIGLCTTELSIGVRTSRGIMASIVPRFTVLPCTRSLLCTTECDAVTELTIQLLRG